MASSSPPKVERVWKGIWKIKTPNKIRHFIGRAAKDLLPTKQNLKFRHILLDDTCALCDDQPETLLHYLWFRPHAQAVWRSDITFANLYRRKYRSFFDVMQNSSSYHVALFSTIAWSLWQRQNQLKENQGTWPLHEVGDRAKALVVEFLEANKHISNPSSRLVAPWSTPSENCYKVNFDATLFDHLGCVGIEVVVRDHKGVVMAALSQKIVLPQSIALVEARATHKVMTFAQEMSFLHVQIEGDCLGVIHALQSQGQCNTLYGHVVGDTRRLGNALHSSQFFHIRREGNKLAHDLARRAVLFADIEVWVEDLLDDLDIVFRFDFH